MLQEQLFATVAICCAIENGDAHLKNFAVLYKNAQSPVRLAPAYDLVSTTVYRARDVMALELGGTKGFPDRKRLVAFGREACGIGSSTVKRVMEQVEHWRRSGASADSPIHERTSRVLKSRRAFARRYEARFEPLHTQR